MEPRSIADQSRGFQVEGQRRSEWSYVAMRVRPLADESAWQPRAPGARPFAERTVGTLQTSVLAGRRIEQEIKCRKTVGHQDGPSPQVAEVRQSGQGWVHNAQAQPAGPSPWVCKFKVQGGGKVLNECIRRPDP